MKNASLFATSKLNVLIISMGDVSFLTAERNAADRICDRLFLDAGGSQTCDALYPGISILL